jgi:hypothetical protein
VRYREKILTFEIKQKIPIITEFMSGNWQYWSNLHVLLSALFSHLYVFSYVGVPQDMKNYFRCSSMEEWFGNTALRHGQ